MLDLSNVTLLFVETRAHEITKRVIEDCLTKARFGAVLIYTDKPDKFAGLNAWIIPCEDFPNKKLAGAFYYGRAMEAVETDFALMLEWDAGIFDASKWRPEFFNYDYIGAPWPPKIARDRYDVGNGGFTLMSRKLGHYAVQNVRRLPVYTDMDFCRFQRPRYEEAGFKWPDAKLASYFAWELGPRNPDHFGYHGAFTWPLVLPKGEIVERTRLMLKSPYLITKAGQLFNAAQWLFDEVPVEELAPYLAKVPQLRPRIPGIVSPHQRAALRLAHVQRGHLVRTSTGDKA